MPRLVFWPLLAPRRRHSFSLCALSLCNASCMPREITTYNGYSPFCNDIAVLCSRLECLYYKEKKGPIIIFGLSRHQDACCNSVLSKTVRRRPKKQTESAKGYVSQVKKQRNNALTLAHTQPILHKRFIIQRGHEHTRTGN